MAPSPESISVHDRFFSKGSPVPFRAPLILWCSLRASPFSLLSSNSRGSRRNRHVRTVECPFQETPWIRGGGSSAGSFSTPPPAPVPFSQWESWAGAGRTAAASSPLLWLQLPSVPVVTCSRCSHNSMKGGGRVPGSSVNPFLLPLTLSWLPGSCPSVQHLYSCCLRNPTPPSHQPQGDKLFAPSFLHLFSSYIRFLKTYFAAKSICKCWFKCAWH